ncbi:MAG: hypothetical protein GX020_08120 [Firmicutes bacterium]|nr:hypothetical protein [Bacillota bacterium]
MKAKTLCLVPHQQLARKWQQFSQEHQRDLLPFSIRGLVSFLLKEKGLPYWENRLLEELAIWEALWQLDLEEFASLRQFPGFVKELRRIFHQIDMQEDVLGELSSLERQELLMIYEFYHNYIKQHKVLDEAGQLKHALDYLSESKMLKDVEQIELKFLVPDELFSLQREFIERLSEGRKVIVEKYPEAKSVTVNAASDLKEEVEIIARDLRQKIENGVSPAMLGVAFPNLDDYLPFIYPIFDRHQIPWKKPAFKLSDTPLAKGILSVYSGEIEGWQKRNFLQLTEQGWGLPFNLNSEERRLLRLAAPSKGFIAWREQLRGSSNFDQLFTELNELLDLIAKKQSIAQHCYGLRKILDKFPPQRWEITDVESMGLFLKALDGFLTIIDTLQTSYQVITMEEFYLVLKDALTAYTLRASAQFTQSVQISSLDQAVGMDFEYLYLGGLIEDAFPRLASTHWLTKIAHPNYDEALFARLKQSSKNLRLSYPEADTAGRTNLPSPLLDTSEIVGVGFEVKQASSGTSRRRVDDGNLDDKLISTYLSTLFSSNTLSATSLNYYAECPYKFYCSEVLKLEALEEEAEEPTALELGNLIHKTLYLFWERHQEGPLPLIEDAQQEIVEIAESSFKDEGQELPRFVAKQFRKFIRKDIQALPDGFRPRYLEKRFDGVKLVSSLGTVTLRGVFDRVDVNNREEYILYDYKSGRSPDLQNVLAGKNIQLPVYLLAIKDMLPGRVLGAAFYSFKTNKRVGLWLLSAIKDLKIRKGSGCLSNPEWEETLEFLENKLVSYVEGIFNGDFRVNPISLDICKYCPFLGVCRREAIG